MTCEAGTYRWMAPEVVFLVSEICTAKNLDATFNSFSYLNQLFSRDPIPRGVKKHYDHKVDVYSFSIVLWELLTNKVPFKGRDNITIAYAASKVCLNFSLSKSNNTCNTQLKILAHSFVFAFQILPISTKN